MISRRRFVQSSMAAALVPLLPRNALAAAAADSSTDLAIRQSWPEFAQGPYCQTFIDTIGKMRANKGNFGVLVRAYTYIRTYGPDGLLHVSQSAILNANYLKHELASDYEIAYPQTCQHEFVATAERQKEENDVTALDVAKRLLDFGMYAPTIYFPLIVHEALMIEPTETETRETLDYFVSVMRQIAEEARTNPEVVKTAPHTTPVGRLDQALAARKPNLRWTKGQEETH